MESQADRKPLRAFLAASAFYLYNGFITHLPCYGVRHAYLRRVLGIRLGPGASVHMGCFFTGRRTRIGAHSVINRRCYLDGRGGLEIGENVSISPECYLVTLGHDAQSPTFDAVPGPVSIGDHAWLGARAMVLPGISLGAGTVVGAGSVVTRSSDPFAIIAGAPARPIGKRNPDLKYRLSYFPYFDTDVQG